jgi:alanine dehydrogenase
MNIGVLRERKQDENRVALQPAQAAQLIARGHRVLVEAGLGLCSGFSDDAYAAQGAAVCGKAEVLADCDLILKVKAPLESEFADYQERHTLFTYLHFDENIPADKIARLIRTGFLGIAYEWVEKDGDYPLLSPMSRLTGYLFAQRSVDLCSRHKGIVCGRYEQDLPGARVLIIGLGRIGLSAAAYFIHNRARLTLLDKHPETINARLNAKLGTHCVDHIARHGIEVLGFDQAEPQRSVKALDELLPRTDIVLCCAVRRPDLPKERLEYLIDEPMVRRMQPNSVICDATACDKDLIETAVSKESLVDFDVIHGVIHFSCDHFPAYVGRTATELLTAATFPYVQAMADLGVHRALRELPDLRRGVSCFQGHVTLKRAAVKKGMAFRPIEELLARAER